MMEKESLTFGGTGDAYWWLIQLDWYFQANICILEKMKVEWVTLFALRGDAYMWWSSWKQGKQNITWERFERAFIKKFIPELWEMMEGDEQENNECILNEVVENDELPMEVGNNNSSEQSDRKLPATATVIPSVTEFIAQPNSECHNESVIEFEGIVDATTEKQRSEKKSRSTFTLEDGTLLKEKPSKEPTTTCQSNIIRPPSKLPVASLPASTLPCRAPLSPEPPDVGSQGASSRLATTLLRQVPPPKPPDLGDSGNGKGDQKMEDYLRVFITEGEKNLEEIRVKWAFDDKVRVKWTIDKLGIILNLMGQIDKSLPSILHSHNLSSLEQHTSTLLSYESSNAPQLLPITWNSFISEELGREDAFHGTASHIKVRQHLFNYIRLRIEHQLTFTSTIRVHIIGPITVSFMQWSSLNLDVLIVDSVLEISLASRCHPIIEEEVKVLEVVKYIKDNKHDGKSKATTIENEKFVDDNNVGRLWILCGGFVPIYKEALSVQEFVAPSVKPLGINLHVKLSQTRSDSFNKEILEIEGCYMDKMNVGIQCRLEIVLVEMFMKFGLVSWTCGSAFWYAIIRWCDRNEVYDEPTIDNLGDTWAEKVQPNHTTLFLDFSTCSHNSHTVKRILLEKMGHHLGD